MRNAAGNVRGRVPVRIRFSIGYTAAQLGPEVKCMLAFCKSCQNISKAAAPSYLLPTGCMWGHSGGLRVLASPCRVSRSLWDTKSFPVLWIQWHDILLKYSNRPNWIPIHGALRAPNILFLDTMPQSPASSCPHTNESSYRSAPGGRMPDSRTHIRTCDLDSPPDCSLWRPPLSPKDKSHPQQVRRPVQPTGAPAQRALRLLVLGHSKVGHGTHMGF